MKSFRFRLLIAALAVLMGSAIAKSQTVPLTLLLRRPCMATALAWTTT